MKDNNRQQLTKINNDDNDIQQQTTIDNNRKRQTTIDNDTRRCAKTVSTGTKNCKKNKNSVRFIDQN